MSDNSYLPETPEQDAIGDGSLPTYEDLATQQGPNSRFGRWRGWIEKRAAERYLDLTPEERRRRRERGWGNDLYEDSRNSESQYNVVSHGQSPSTISVNTTWSELSTRFEGLSLSAGSSPQVPSEGVFGRPLPASEECIHPSHLWLQQFGSRFLPHSSSPINALLPLPGDRLVLIGHNDGLSVLDMFPSGDPETSSPAEARVRPIWISEGVHQLELLEFQDTGDPTPLGVVLALIGIEGDPLVSRERDVTRLIRMYNLSSLTALARWATTDKASKPVDLSQSASCRSGLQANAKKHKRNSSLFKFKTQMLQESSSLGPIPPPKDPSPLLRRQQSTSSVDLSWDFLEDLPLRWATDHVPLATPGSRLMNTNVVFFELSRTNRTIDSADSTVLAVGTKSGFLLYEAPRGERAFRFVKEFYTPVPPRAATFVQQRSYGSVRISPSSSQGDDDGTYQNRRCRYRSSVDSDLNRSQSLSSPGDYDMQLHLFVVFDKKAGLIRIADAIVGEIELWEETLDSTSARLASPKRFNLRESKAIWLTPTFEVLPLYSPTRPVHMVPVYLLTRDRHTHILPYPLPFPPSSRPPLFVLKWRNQPTHVRHRVCSPSNEPAFLQVISIGKYGIEVQEVPLSLIMKNRNGRYGKDKGKGTEQSEEPIRAIMDCGVVGFLCRGGQWHKSKYYRFLSRSSSMVSYSSAGTVSCREHSEDGFYAWWRKDYEDWRVIWVGGMDKNAVMCDVDDL